MPIREASSSTWSQDVVLVPAAAEGHIWVRGKVAAGVCVDVGGQCHLWGPWESCMIKSEGHPEWALSFTGLGKVGPTSC